MQNSVVLSESVYAVRCCATRECVCSMFDRALVTKRRRERTVESRSTIFLLKIMNVNKVNFYANFNVNRQRP